ncbi:glycosyltransferase family 4 protein [Aquisalimonas lutea]|uniref:glycosyltransferase family 4 protein n=1 Tax=Aquisalimonas lutea TaxID=1327750 RepID=UPI0025B4AF64|nr:glycosyltransferase family 4 protein [Aquisalimonas lutea]MDN3516209.1 glycosyltransferase family 4 protein [Aquisalimonas lutea]
MTEALHFLVPGSLEACTGGTLYDARMIAAARAAGTVVPVHELPGRFPDADAVARDALHAALGAVPDGAVAVVDGLALGDQPDTAIRHAGRLRLLALVHHPLADETGVDATTRQRFLEREPRALHACRGVIVTSAFTAERLQALGLPAGRIRIAEPGTAPAAPARGPGPGAPPALLCVGSLTPRKGQDVLVAALATLAQRHWTCTLAGCTDADPAFAAGVRERIRATGLGDRITLAGQCPPEALDALLAGASIFVLPSRYEGYGMALTEALARGLPVVSTTGGAIPRTVPADAGRLVAPGDHRALARALDELLQDPAARAAAAEAARRHAAGLPDWPRAAGQFARAVEALS